MKYLATVSDGTYYTMSALCQRAKTKVSKLQWRNRNKILGNKKLGIKASDNDRKYYIKLASNYPQRNNIRRDTIHQKRSDLSRRVYCIPIEDLNFPYFKKCSNCGHIQSMKLSDRVFCCQRCNHTLDRDKNASINLENAPDKIVSRLDRLLNACGQE